MSKTTIIISKFLIIKIINVITKKKNNCKSKSFSPIISINHFNISIEIKIIILKTKYQVKRKI